MLRIDFDGSDQRLLAYIRSRMPVLREALRIKMTGLMIALQAHIVGEKLSGQVLHHRTGKLIDSIRLDPPSSKVGSTAVLNSRHGRQGKR